MRVSVTERALYKRCRRKWDYTSWNRQSLAPVINAPALDLGTVVHATLAAWTQDPTANPSTLYSSTAQAHLAQIIQSYTERVGCAPSEFELKATIDQLGLGAAMIENYAARWHTPLPPGFTLVQNELTLITPVPGTKHITRFNRDNEPVYALHELEATFDGVMEDANGDLFIIERKTFSRTPQIEELNNNDQFLAYQWALSQHTKNVVGVSYDGLLKKPKPSGVHATLNDLFLRRLLLRPQAELDEFGVMLAQELIEMANPNLPLYKTVPAVTGCQRWECSFLDVCHATSKGEPTEDLLKMFTRSSRKQHLELTT